jgi:hypothetical protein
MKTLQEKIAVMQAFADGKKIEICDSGVSNWRGSINPTWNWDLCNYRVKHDPVVVEHEFYVTQDHDGTVWAGNFAHRKTPAGKIKVRVEDGKLVSVEIVK